MILRCYVPIDPVGKARPRVTANGTYTPRATKAAQKAIRAAWVARNPHGFGSEALIMAVQAVMARPKSVKRQHPTVKPDNDNVLKLCMDALNGLAYADDKQVVVTLCVKRYCEPDEEPHLMIEIKEVEGSPAELLAAAERTVLLRRPS